MKDKKVYSLGEAIQKFHETERLEIDLSTTIADRIFPPQKPGFVLPERLLYILAAALIGGGLVYSFGFLKTVSIPSLVLLVAFLTAYFALSFKEYHLFSRKFFADKFTE